MSKRTLPEAVCCPEAQHDLLLETMSESAAGAVARTLPRSQEARWVYPHGVNLDCLSNDFPLTRVASPVPTAPLPGAASLPEEEQAVLVLRLARQFIQRGWCRGAGALRPRSGLPATACAFWDSEATMVCLDGAINRAGHVLELPVGAAKARLLAALPSKKRRSIVSYNDRLGRRQTTILRRLDIAIAGK